MLTPDFTLLNDIREVNLSYLILAQRLLRDNPIAGQFRLGVDADAAQTLLSFSPAQLVKLAGAGALVCSFRLNDSQLLGALAQEPLGGILQQAHATLLLAQQDTQTA